MNNAKSLLQDSLANKNPYDDWEPSVPKGMSLDFGSKDFVAMEKLALKSNTFLKS